MSVIKDINDLLDHWEERESNYHKLHLEAVSKVQEFGLRHFTLKTGIEKGSKIKIYRTPERTETWLVSRLRFFKRGDVSLYGYRIYLNGKVSDVCKQIIITPMSCKVTARNWELIKCPPQS